MKKHHIKIFNKIELFMDRSLELFSQGGTCSFVTPNNLYHSNYKDIKDNICIIAISNKIRDYLSTKDVAILIDREVLHHLLGHTRSSKYLNSFDEEVNNFIISKYDKNDCINALKNSINLVKSKESLKYFIETNGSFLGLFKYYKNIINYYIKIYKLIKHLKTAKKEEISKIVTHHVEDKDIVEFIIYNEEIFFV